MKIAAVFAVLSSLALLPRAARAESIGSATVRHYFEALGRNDFKRALALTEGAALERTARMVGTLQKQAHDHQAAVELKLRSLRVAEHGGACDAGLPVPVDVTFDIDVVGKKWFFSKVARKLAGKAQFFVAAGQPRRIVAIEGQLQ